MDRPVHRQRATAATRIWRVEQCPPQQSGINGRLRSSALRSAAPLHGPQDKNVLRRLAEARQTLIP